MGFIVIENQLIYILDFQTANRRKGAAWTCNYADGCCFSFCNLQLFSHAM